MPIKIPDDLPARDILEREGMDVLREKDAVRQDIRPLRIGLLNLMPNKIQTETQIARLIGATPLQVELTLVRMSEHIPRNTNADHMASFYRPWIDVQAERFDGFILTGAPVERLTFEAVSYWDELRQLLDWTQSHVHRCLTLCWAAQAALYHFHGLPKHELPQKAFGVYPHRVLSLSSPYLRGFCEEFSAPVSRWTEVRKSDIREDAELEILAESAVTGICLIGDPVFRSLHMFNHLEYDTTTLADEYFRDAGRDPNTIPPNQYFPNNDLSQLPTNSWRCHAHLLFANWINEIYQTVPFEFTRSPESQ
nr:homoserine O-succinyltransferase [uncultured Acidocella sp.]